MFMKKNTKPYLLLLFILVAGSIFGCGALSQEITPTSEEISLDSVPEYDGASSVAINNNVPFFEDSDMTTEAFEEYSPLDELGRCGVAYANICPEIMPTEPRGEIGAIRPSGWHTSNYHELIDGNYLYNRCHLIAFSLAGENANEENLITGTRYMNTEGMIPYEDEVREYVKDTGHHVLYRVTPIFTGDNLVADGVLMEAQSVEDSQISFCVYCYNVQPNIEIDYQTGESYAAAKPPYSSKSIEDTDIPADEIDYILNTNTCKFHYPDCKSVSKISDHNRKEYSGKRDKLIDSGYSPCGNCHP